MPISEGQVSDYKGAALMLDALPAPKRCSVTEATIPTGSAQRRWARLLSVFLMPILSLSSILWARPFRWRRLHPLVPFLLTFDGCMSCFRVYTEDELREMTREVDPEGTFDWRIGSFRLGWMPFDCPYLLGSPRFASPLPEA